jgi:hypothetical protein
VHAGSTYWVSQHILVARDMYWSVVHPSPARDMLAPEDYGLVDVLYAVQTHEIWQRHLRDYYPLTDRCRCASDEYGRLASFLA